MSKIVNRTIFALFLCTALFTQSVQAQWPKKTKKAQLQEQLDAERQRADSLLRVIEKMRADAAAEEAEVATKTSEENLNAEVAAVDYTPATADSLAQALQLTQTREAFDSFFADFICEPTTLDDDKSLDSLYEARLRCIVSPINLPYNAIIRTYIKNYTSNYSMMHNVVPLTKYYFPMIDEELIKAGLPIELHAMAIIESGLNPTITSRAGAGGLWQFIPSTARAYGLTVNSMVDERFDPVKSTRAACRFMKDLYNMYNDWGLALAAYNCGPGNVNKALAATGGDPTSFWEVYWYLPSETRGYVPAFVAALYTYNYHQAHNIRSGNPPLPLAVDTVHVSRLLHFDQIASTIDIDKQTLQMLNPQYKHDIIPAVDKTYTLILPTNRLTDYIVNRDSIFAKDSLYLGDYLNPSTMAKKLADTEVIYHKVKSGETLGAIARKYRVTTKQLMKWNNLKNADKLRIGQRIRIER